MLWMLSYSTVQSRPSHSTCGGDHGLAQRRSDGLGLVISRSLRRPDTLELKRTFCWLDLINN